MNRAGVLAVGSLAIISLTGFNCSGFFNSGGPTIENAQQNAETITASSSLSPGCGTIPYTRPPTSQSNVTAPITWHETLSDNSTTNAPILWPEGNGGSPNPIEVWINPAVQSNVSQQVQGALVSWNSALVANATGSVRIAYQLSNDVSSANVIVEDSSTMYLQQDSGGTIAGSQEFDSYSSDFTNLLLAKVIINDGLSPMTTYVTSVHELGHALGLGHSVFQRSVMYPTATTCLQSTTDSNFDYADLNFLEANYDPPYASGPSVVASSSPNPSLQCLHAPQMPQASSGSASVKYTNSITCGFASQYTQTLTLYENGTAIGTTQTVRPGTGQRQPPNSPLNQTLLAPCSSSGKMYYATESFVSSGPPSLNSTFRSSVVYLGCSP